MNDLYAKLYGPAGGLQYGCPGCRLTAWEIGPIQGPEMEGRGTPLVEPHGPRAGIPVRYDRDRAWASVQGQSPIGEGQNTTQKGETP